MAILGLVLILMLSMLGAFIGLIVGPIVGAILIPMKILNGSASAIPEVVSDLFNESNNNIDQI